MNPTILVSVGGLVLSLLVMLGNFMYSRGRQDLLETNLKGEIENLRNQVQKQWAWKDDHVDEAAEHRYEFQRQIGKIEAIVAVRDTQYMEILRVIAAMEKTINEKIEDIRQDLSDLHLHKRSSD